MSSVFESASFVARAGSRKPSRACGNKQNTKRIVVRSRISMIRSYTISRKSEYYKRNILTNLSKDFGIKAVRDQGQLLRYPVLCNHNNIEGHTI